MPKKVKLKLDDLNIESFKTSSKNAKGGGTHYVSICDHDTCYGCLPKFSEAFPKYDCKPK